MRAFYPRRRPTRTPNVKVDIVMRRTPGDTSRWSCPWARADGVSALGQGELADIGIAVAEQFGAAGQILHVAVVDLARLEGDGFFLVLLQSRGPDFQGAGVMQAQRLYPVDGEAGAGGVLLDRLRVRKLPAGEDLIHDELEELQMPHGDRQVPRFEVLVARLD